MWLVPLLVGLPLLICGGCCVGSFFFGSRALATLEPFTTALERIQNDGIVRDRLGEPIEPGMFPSHFQFNDQMDTGNAEFQFDVSGPKGSAKVSTEADKQSGNWRTTKLDVTFEDGETISLVP
jgi:hypothetical protein